MDEQIKVIATYVSGREEHHFVKKTKTFPNKKLTELMNKLRTFPNIINVRIDNGEK